jgi:hypothetical protein
MNVGSPAIGWALAAVGIGLLVVPLVVSDDDDAAAGFSGHIQSGTCAQPSGDFMVDLESEDSSYDVEPYVAVGDDGEPVTLGYYGASGVPGFGLGAIYTDQQFSMVIADAESGEDVACGDILRPDADKFGEAGLALVQLLPVGSGDEESAVQGVAALERATLQRELDITPTNVRIMLSTGPVSTPAEASDAYDGYVQGGRCESPTGDVHIDLKNRDDDDEPAVTPYQAISAETGDPVTLGYYGTAGAPGFGVAAAYTDQDFSLVIEDESGEPAGCGDILEPDAGEFEDAGLALVQVQPVGEAGVQGFVVMDRVEMQRELDVTPTVFRVLLFAPSANAD